MDRAEHSPSHGRRVRALLRRCVVMCGVGSAIVGVIIVATNALVWGVRDVGEGFVIFAAWTPVLFMAAIIPTLLRASRVLGSDDPEAWSDRCIACDYDRRGLPESSACPECGTQACGVSHMAG